ncbi:MAG: hypothetical protein QOG31_668 [Thermoplasmata archaeon]|jgi:hypothetical protein|nr:hypothetical protein [Thermoplasmata archaeon]
MNPFRFAGVAPCGQTQISQTLSKWTPNLRNGATRLRHCTDLDAGRSPSVLRNLRSPTLPPHETADDADFADLLQSAVWGGAA